MNRIQFVHAHHIRTCCARGHAASGGASLTAFLIACVFALPAVDCAAQESTGSMGSVFRPQGMVDAPAAGKNEQAGANLSGLRVIVIGKSHAVASVDGQIVHVGDTVNGMRVMKIDPNGVVLAGEGGASERLTVYPSVIKRNVTNTAPKATRNSNGVAQ